jgi:hypothetical protein
VVVDFGGRSSDTTNDRNVGLVGVGVDIIVEDSELDFRLNRQMTGVGDEYTHVKYLIGNQGCLCSGGDKVSELSNHWRIEEAGSEECHSGQNVRVVVSEIYVKW